MVEDAGNAPVVSTASFLTPDLQSGCRIISRESGTPPWCCPTDAWIWKPGCAAGARRVKGCSGPGFPPDHRPEGDAPKFARTLCATTGDGGFSRSSPAVAPPRPALLLDRRSFFRRRRGHHCKIRKLKGPDRVRRPGPCHFNKEQTPSQVVIAAATGISRWTFRCLGHTSSEALRL